MTEKNKGKLHELLAVDAGLKATSQKVLTEGIKTLQKQDCFDGLSKTYKAINEDGIVYNPEIKTITTTVRDKIKYIEGHVVRMLDCAYQKEVANTEAKADIIIDGNTLAKDVPATYLLSLEKTINNLRDLYLAIPTLAPGYDWRLNKNDNERYISQAIDTRSTKKVIKPIVKYEATKDHPAQTELVSLDEVVGTWTTIHVTSRLSVADKSNLLAKVDKILRSIKKARARANCAETNSKKIGKELFNYINS